MNEPLLMEISKNGRGAYVFPALDLPRGFDSVLPDFDEVLRRKSVPALPQVSELDVVRHFSRLSSMTFGVDYGFYPLGSCTMKYNPKVSEKLASMEQFTEIHPLQDVSTIQGCLSLMYNLLEDLSSITGMAWGTLQPCAGAHGEYTGLKIIRSWFEAHGESGRTRILVPESAHGTNPASAAVNGFTVTTIPANSEGLVDVQALAAELDESVAAIMLTNPNTLGLFEKDILAIAEMVHGVGAKLYYDGANFNAILGVCTPGDMGFDVVHLNLHKTFGTPHGGGGPGAGPVMVTRELAPYLPKPDVKLSDSGYAFKWDSEHSIGKVSMFWGNFLVLVRAYSYIARMGADGLRAAAAHAVLNANYLLSRLAGTFDVPYGPRCKHEFVLSLQRLKDETGVSALDVAKALLDRGYHPPTMYFPMIVHEALMLEPTESESPETLDAFADALIEIEHIARTNPQLLKGAPYETVVRRVDEVSAAKNPHLKY